MKRPPDSNNTDDILQWLVEHKNEFKFDIRVMYEECKPERVENMKYYPPVETPTIHIKMELHPI